MTDRRKIETGEIQKSSAESMKNTKLEYQTERTRDDTLDATMSGVLGDNAEDNAIREAIAASSGSRRDQGKEILPTDPLDDELPHPRPKP